MFDGSSLVIVACSGGPDSVCLLHAMARLRRLFRLDVACFHFDHGLRSGSERDAAYVRRQAERLAVPFHARRAVSKPKHGESVEAWARMVRYAALLALAEELGGLAATGHTADDQAETVLLALLRGGGLDAMTGMSLVARPIVHPLLETTREQTEAFCRALRLRPRRDPMNEDPAYMRVALRKSVIPQLERALGRGVRSTLVRSADLLRSDAQLLDRLGEEAFAQVATTLEDGSRLLAAAVRSLPPSLASRVVRLALLDLGLVPEATHVEAVLDLASGRKGRRISLPDGLRARSDGEYVRLSRPSPGTRPSARPPAR
jgi:tRNA(Ile)-lysidine synthase